MTAATTCAGVSFLTSGVAVAAVVAAAVAVAVAE